MQLALVHFITFYAYEHTLCLFSRTYLSWKFFSSQDIQRCLKDLDVQISFAFLHLLLFTAEVFQWRKVWEIFNRGLTSQMLCSFLSALRFQQSRTWKEFALGGCFQGFILKVLSNSSLLSMLGLSFWAAGFPDSHKSHPIWIHIYTSVSKMEIKSQRLILSAEIRTLNGFHFSSKFI